MDRRLLDYFPEYLRDFREIKQIADSEQPEFESLWNGVGQLMDDQFILDSTLYGIKRLEGLYGIAAKGTETVEERRARLITKANERLPYTIAMLRSQLETLCGNYYSLEVDYHGYTVIVRIWPHKKLQYLDVADMLERIVPVNMAIDQDLRRNLHSEVGLYTHQELRNFTHQFLREEVLPHAEPDGQI